MENQLRSFRKEAGFESMETFARHMCCSLSYIGQLELGKKVAGRRFIEKFSAKFPSADIVKIFFGGEK